MEVKNGLIIKINKALKDFNNLASIFVFNLKILNKTKTIL